MTIESIQHLRHVSKYSNEIRKIWDARKALLDHPEVTIGDIRSFFRNNCIIDPIIFSDAQKALLVHPEVTIGDILYLTEHGLTEEICSKARKALLVHPEVTIGDIRSLLEKGRFTLIEEALLVHPEVTIGDLFYLYEWGCTEEICSKARKALLVHPEADIRDIKFVSRNKMERDCFGGW